jgi:hypothetical protein
MKLLRNTTADTPPHAHSARCCPMSCVLEGEYILRQWPGHTARRDRNCSPVRAAVDVLRPSLVAPRAMCWVVDVAPLPVSGHPRRPKWSLRVHWRFDDVGAAALGVQLGPMEPRRHTEYGVRPMDTDGDPPRLAGRRGLRPSASARSSSVSWFCDASVTPQKFGLCPGATISSMRSPFEQNIHLVWLDG